MASTLPQYPRCGLTQSQLSDVSFQRHILMQALILLDFLLSLTEDAQKKLDSSGIAQLNSAVNYKITLSEEKVGFSSHYHSHQINLMSL